MIKIALLLVWMVAVVSSADARLITFDDLYGLPRAHSAQVSPDGKQIAFLLRTTDFEANKYHTHLWIMNADGSGQRQLVDLELGESHVRWAASGEWLYFLSSVDGVSQIWQVSPDSGEPTRITDLAMGVKQFKFFDHDSKVIFVTSSWPECEDQECHRRRLEEEENRPVEARVYDRLFHRKYSYWTDDKIQQLWVYNVEADSAWRTITGEIDVPTAHLGSGRDFDVCSDGPYGAGAVIVNLSDTPAVATHNHLHILNPLETRPWDAAHLSGLMASAPQFIPGGCPDVLLYTAQARVGYESDQTDLILRHPHGDDNLTAEFDRSPWGAQWHADGNSIWFTAVDAGRSGLYQCGVVAAPNSIVPVLDDAVYGDIAVDPQGDYLVLTRSQAHEPHELYRYDFKDRKLTRLTRFTEPIVSQLDLSVAQDFWFAGFNGDSVHGFLTMPPDFDESKEYPFLLLIHGGPQWCWLGDFNYYGWNTQLMAAQGYIVAQIDPHGSTGYGLEFKEYVSGNWGRGDYEDLMLGVDWLIGEHPQIDTIRMAALGRSYGGFMVNWINGHTDRFKCLIGIDGTFNQVSEYGTTDELWFPEWEAGGTPYDNLDEYLRSSPMMYAKNFKTPQMIVHGQKDYRVDVSEGLQMFTALQRQGVPSRLVYFPDEGHSVRKLNNLRFVYDQQLGWLEQWLKPGGAEAD